jgi:CBS domain-containing protein
MKVFEIMTLDVGFCGLEDSLAKAAEIMWQKDCGIVPIVDAENRVVGMITDRDIAIAAATRNLKPSEIKSKEMIFREIAACEMNNNVKKVLKKMRRNRVKRLPVTSEKGELLGIISISDILLKASRKKSLRKKIFLTLKAIFAPVPIVLCEKGE